MLFGLGAVDSLESLQLKLIAPHAYDRIGSPSFNPQASLSIVNPAHFKTCSFASD